MKTTFNSTMVRLTPDKYKNNIVDIQQINKLFLLKKLSMFHNVFIPLYRQYNNRLIINILKIILNIFKNNF